MIICTCEKIKTVGKGEKGMVKSYLHTKKFGSLNFESPKFLPKAASPKRIGMHI